MLSTTTRRGFGGLSLAGLLGACATQLADPSGRAEPAMKAVLDAWAAMNPKPIATLSVAEARLQPPISSAAMAVARARGADMSADMAVQVREISVGGGAGPLRATLYDPMPGGAPKPVILFFHGGGWVIASPEVYDASARGLARRTGAIVVSVAYRLAPEARFPAQHDDAIASYAWLTANAGSIGGDPRRIAVAGESAGGNLALHVGVAAREMGLPRPAGLLLVYPVAGTDLGVPSAREHADAKPLNTAALSWFLGHLLGSNAAGLVDLRLNPVLRPALGPLPPTTVVLAEIDPLRSGGETLVARLAEAGVAVQSRLFPAVTHEFFGMAAVVPAAAEAQEFAAINLRAAFAAVPQQMAQPATPAPTGRRPRR